MAKQFKQFYVVEANFKRSFTGHGPDAIDAEMLVEGEFGRVYLCYNDFCGQRFGVSDESVLKQLEADEPHEIQFVEEWEGGLDATKKSRFYLGFKELSAFADRMAYLNVNAKKHDDLLTLDGDKVLIGDRNSARYGGYTEIPGVEHGMYAAVDGKEYLVTGEFRKFIEQIKDFPPCQFQELLRGYVSNLEPDIVDGKPVVKKGAAKTKKAGSKRLGSAKRNAGVGK